MTEARLDLDRTRRIDLPEAIYCQHKTVDDTVAIVAEMLDRGSDAVIATRITNAQAEPLRALDPHVEADTTMVWRPRPATGRSPSVVAAGTSDRPVTTECELTLTALGHDPTVVSDVGVAGLHRLLAVVDELDRADAIVAIAGMEGALPTVLAGLVSRPIVAVPTSVGYGAAFDGQTALHSMLASCAPGIAVVGIDNGYGAACAVHRILTALGPPTER